MFFFIFVIIISVIAVVVEVVIMFFITRACNVVNFQGNIYNGLQYILTSHLHLDAICILHFLIIEISKFYVANNQYKHL